MSPLSSLSQVEMLPFDAGSFRDRTGRVFYENGRVYRALNAVALADWQALSTANFFKTWAQTGRLVGTESSPRSPADFSLSGEWAVVLEHAVIPFISYPYEWTFGMLQDAALLCLELLIDAVREDLVLKDGSAYNVQWRGSQPVFIDIPSLQKLEPGEPWTGYRQFCQMFLFPLMLQAYKNVPFQPWLRGSIDGIDPADCRNLMSSRDLLRPGVFRHVWLHAKLQSLMQGTQRDMKQEVRNAGFSKDLILANAQQLLKLVRKLRWRSGPTTWSNYATSNSYTDVDREAKEQFVRAAVHDKRRTRVWDLGCNTGTFSRIAAENAEQVIAMDADPLAVERMYQSLKKERNERILPLLNNLADPSPNLGWRQQERKSLPERGKPELTLCLALIHHLVIGANIPLPEFLHWLADLKTDLVIEFVTKQDPMVRILLRNKPDHYADYEQGLFEQLLADLFEVKRREDLASGTRTLYYARARSGT